MQLEEWRPVIGWPYEVSESGRLRRTTTSSNYKAGRELKGKIRPTGHVMYSLLNGGRKTTKYVFAHILVCEAWNGPKPTENHEVAHWDGNPQHNHYSNLRWATHKENSHDRFRHSTTPLGSNNPAAKLTEKDILFIKYARKDGLSYSRIAKLMNVSVGCIGDICRKKNWKHILLEEENAIT